MDNIGEAVIRQSLFSRLPKWLRIVITVLLIITVIFYLVKLIVFIMNNLRRFVHWATDIKQYRVFWFCVLLVSIGAFIYAQFFLGLDPLGKAINFIELQIDNVKDYIISLID